MKNVLVVIYAHPEGYPPTLNAISELSRISGKVSLLGRNILIPTWQYPANCEVEYASRYIDVRGAEQRSIFAKCKYFFDFVFLIFKRARKEKYDLILAYDPMALFASWLVFSFFKKKPIVWYHNHDIFEEDKVRKYSIQWLSGKFEKRIFNSINIFSLPSNERKKHFPLDLFDGKYFFLPNFPAIGFFGNFYRKKQITNNVRLIFQGAISEGHGLEEIAGLLNQTILGKSLHFVVKGWIRDELFRDNLKNIATAINCVDRLEFVGYGPYKELPLLTASCHIGIGVHAMQTDLHTSLGKASNKLYEYASLGLPIIVYDNEHYRNHLGKYSWVFFTDLSKESLINCIHEIVANYDQLSKKAHEDFKNELNFELNFKEVADYLTTLS